MTSSSNIRMASLDVSQFDTNTKDLDIPLTLLNPNNKKRESPGAIHLQAKYVEALRSSRDSLQFSHS